MSITISRASPRNPNPQSQPLDGAPGPGRSIRSADDDDNLLENLDEDELLEQIIGWWRTDSDYWSAWRQEAHRCFDFRAGHQWDAEDLKILQDQTRPAITFNRVGPFVDSVGGLEINNRQETLFSPRQVGATGVNDVLTGANNWARQECDAEDEETEAFLDAVTCGIGCVQTRMDYDDDPDGMLVEDRVDPLEMLPDSASRKQNFADGQHLMRIKDIPLERACEMFPDEPEEDLHADWAEDQAGEASDPHNARLAPFYRIDQSGQNDRAQMMCRMVEVEWWQFEKAYRVLDPSTGRWFLVESDKAMTLAIRSRMLGFRLQMVPDRKKKYYKAIVGRRVIRSVPGAEKGGFSYKFITGKRDQTKGTWYGIVRAMCDPQMWANKWLSQGLHILNTNAKGGLLAEQDAFTDPDEAEDTWASADSITWLNPGGLNKVTPKNPPEFPTQLNAMMQMAIDAIPLVAGINMELMGQTTTNQPQAALLEAGRRQQGMNVLAALFNSKRRYQKEQGRLALWMITEYIADGRLIRIGGPENAQYVPLIHDPNVAEYDVIVEDAPTSPNMKDKVWGSLMQLFPMLRGMAIPPQFYINSLKYAPVPAAFVTESQQILSQPPPPDPNAQGKQALDQATAQLRSAQAGKAGAEAARTQAETQLAPQKANLDIQEQQAKIEKTRADAANALQNAGIVSDDMRFKQTMAAIDALLSVHSAQLGADQQQHQQVMDTVQHTLAERKHGLAAQQAALGAHQAGAAHGLNVRQHVVDAQGQAEDRSMALERQEHAARSGDAELAIKSRAQQAAEQAAKQQTQGD